MVVIGAAPSIANGLAVTVDLPDGKKGIDLTYTIRPDAHWADGVPVTTADVRFTYEVGRDPQSLQRGFHHGVRRPATGPRR